VGSSIEKIYFERSRAFSDQFVHFKASLLIVPHGTLPQWKQYVLQFPTLKTLAIQCSADVERVVGNNELRRKFWLELIDGVYDVILIGSTFYDIFCMRFFNYRTKTRVKSSGVNYTNRSSKFVVVAEPLAAQMKNRQYNDVAVDPKLKDNVPEDFTMGDDVDFFYEYLKGRLKVPVTIVNNAHEDATHCVSQFVCFNRVVVDEVDTVSLAMKSPSFHALFTWFVSSSIGNMLFPKKNRYAVKGFSGFVNSRSPYYKIMNSIVTMPHVREVFVKNKQDYVEQCIKLPPVTHITIKCQSIRVLRNIPTEAKAGNVSMKTLIAQLQADDFEGVSDVLKCDVNTPEKAIEAYKDMLSNDIRNKEIDLQGAQAKTYATEQGKADAIAKLESDLANMRAWLKNIEHNLSHMDEQEECCICYEIMEKPVVLLCSHMFCSGCLLSAVDSGSKKCPMCNTPLDMKKMTLLTKTEGKKPKTVKASTPKKEIVRTKLQECLYQIQRLVCKSDQARILLFSEHEGSFPPIIAKLTELNIPYGTISGTAAHIQKNLVRFTEGEIKVLLLNAKNFAAGLNIPMATDIILYHKMPTNMTMQAIGRANRVGRKGPLTVYNLLTTEEIGTDYVERE
jgi:hypothetical protein